MFFVNVPLLQERFMDPVELGFALQVPPDGVEQETNTMFVSVSSSEDRNEVCPRRRYCCAVDAANSDPGAVLPGPAFAAATSRPPPPYTTRRDIASRG